MAISLHRAATRSGDRGAATRQGQSYLDQGNSDLRRPDRIWQTHVARSGCATARGAALGSGGGGRRSLRRGDRKSPVRGLWNRRSERMARFRYRTPVLTGQWRDSRAAALRDAIKAKQARVAADEPDGVHWLVPGGIEEDEGQAPRR